MRILGAFVLLSLTFLLAGLSYYAFVESKSVPWGAGYAGTSLCALVIAVSVLTGGPRGNGDGRRR